MFGLRLMTDCAPRTKNGLPAHRMTGAEIKSSAQLSSAGVRPSTRCPPIVNATTTIVSGSVHQKRREKSRSSGFSSSSSVGISGSSAMPQIGQLPGVGWRICGCIGQV
jgi:hypothetical protein